MSGKVWHFSCCQKRKDRGRHLSTAKGKEVHGLPVQMVTGGIDSAPVNDFREGAERSDLPERPVTEFLSSAPVEHKQEAVIEGETNKSCFEKISDHSIAQDADPGAAVHDRNLSTSDVLESKDLAEKVSGSVAPSSEWERDLQLIKKQLETSQTEKRELEAQVLKANQNIRDLRHEIAVLQKRLQVAEKRLPNLPLMCPPPPPPLPPPLPPHVNPLRALMTIIQKRRNSRDPNICPPHNLVLLPEGPEGSGVSDNNRCPGMNEVLEMIRNGVSLRHVMQVHKEALRSGGDGSEPEGSRVMPELQEILKKRKVSADKHVSDGSCSSSIEGDPASRGPSPQRDDTTLRCGFGETGLRSPCEPENFAQGAGVTDSEVDERPIDGDAVCTISTHPLNSLLDQGQADLVSSSPAPDRRFADLDPGACLEEQGLPADSDAVGDATTQTNCSPEPSPVLGFLNWERWNDVNLKAALPLRSIFKSVSLLTSSNGGEKLSLQGQQDHRSTSLEVLESDLSCQSFGSADVSAGTPDVPEDMHGQFSLLHNMLKPPMTSPLSHKEQAQAVIASEALNPEFLGQSVDRPEPDGSLPKD
ncbi:hypothetical protein GJAV_G00032260 [Gymnothorax javanicus]|nr:hypothetical protein GJAV_G00032260 [Gymnothorax javanicus]